MPCWPLNAAVLLTRMLSSAVAESRPPTTTASRDATSSFSAASQGGVVVASYIAALAASFAVVAGVDPSQKASVLSEHISASMRMASFGVLATFPPFLCACVLFVRRYRLPEAP